MRRKTPWMASDRTRQAALSVAGGTLGRIELREVLFSDGLCRGGSCFKLDESLDLQTRVVRTLKNNIE